MIDKMWAYLHFRSRTKGDREPPVGLRWKQWSQVRDLECNLTNDDWKPELYQVAPFLYYQ